MTKKTHHRGHVWTVSRVEDHHAVLYEVFYDEKLAKQYVEQTAIEFGYVGVAWQECEHSWDARMIPKGSSVPLDLYQNDGFNVKKRKVIVRLT